MPIDEADVERRLTLGEDASTEFKGTPPLGYRLDANEVAKAVVSFANSGGGTVFVGIEDDGTVTGLGTVQQADEVMRLASQACQNNAHPPIVCRITKLRVRGQLIVAVEVGAFHADRPYRSGHVYYVRDASVSREARRDELERLFLSAARTHYDEDLVSDATRVADLDHAAIRSFLETVYGVPVTEAARQESEGYERQYLVSLKCMDAHEVPTVAGILFFGVDVSRWLPDARISMVRIEGTQLRSEFSDRRELTGRLPAQIEEAEQVLNRWLSTPARIEGWERVESPRAPVIPWEAVREALLNAVSHRDYRTASQVRVFRFDDRLEIVNPGALLNRLTLDNIRRGGIKQHRNPVVVSLLSRMRRVEALGMGVPEMVRRMTAAGLPEPDFDDQGGHFRVTLRTRQPAP